MSVILKSFSEDVSVTDPRQSKTFLIFESDGEEFRVPVGSDAIQAIVKFIYRNKPIEQKTEDPAKNMNELEEEDDNDEIMAGGLLGLEDASSDEVPSL